MIDTSKWDGWDPFFGCYWSVATPRSSGMSALATDRFADAIESKIKEIDADRDSLKSQAEELLNRHAELGAERPKLVKALESLGRKDPALAEQGKSKHVGVMC